MISNAPNMIEVRGLSHSYGKRRVLDGISLDIPSGAFYALLGANGTGKTTLLQLIMGMQRVRHGQVRVFGTPLQQLSIGQRQRIAYVAEGQQLPQWMRLEEMEDYCRPLYPSWDNKLADSLRERFNLDRRERISQMSRGARMKTALLCALAPRPALLLMDEPFTGMDVAVKDELVRGLLGSMQEENWTVLLSSHDIAEVEMLADWVGFLKDGRVDVSEPLDQLRSRYRRVDVMLDSRDSMPERLPSEWLSVEKAGSHLSFIVSQEREDDLSSLVKRVGPTSSLDVREVSLRELYLALASSAATTEGVRV